MKNKLFYTVSSILLTLVIGCIPMNTRNLSNENNKSTPLSGQPPSHPYYGKIDISLDTSLINYSGGELYHKPRKFVLNDNSDINNFKIESFNIPEIPYIKTFKIENQEKEVKSNFTIYDKTRKYYLIATKIKKDDKLDVNINGIPQINSSDYDLDDHVVVKPIIINESNDISIKYSGKLVNYTSSNIFNIEVINSWINL